MLTPVQILDMTGTHESGTFLFSLFDLDTYVWQPKGGSLSSRQLGFKVCESALGLQLSWLEQEPLKLQVAGSSPANPTITFGVIMYKHYVARLKYHLWRLSRAAEFVLRPEQKAHDKYIKAMRSEDLMKSTLRNLDRLPAHDPNRPKEWYDTLDWFVGTIPHDWERRINERIQKKENNDVVD